MNRNFPPKPTGIGYLWLGIGVFWGLVIWLAADVFIIGK